MLLQPGAQREAGGCQPPLAVLSPPWVNRCPLLPSPPPTPSKTLSHFPFRQNLAPKRRSCCSGADFSRWISLPPGCCSCFQAAPPSPQRSVVAVLSPPGPLTPARKVLWGPQRGWERLQGLLGGRDGKGWMGFRGINKRFFGQPPQIGSTEQHSPHPHRAGGLDNPGLDVAPGKFLPSPRRSRAPKPQASQSQNPSQSQHPSQSQSQNTSQAQQPTQSQFQQPSQSQHPSQSQAQNPS